MIGCGDFSAVSIPLGDVPRGSEASRVIDIMFGIECACEVGGSFRIDYTRLRFCHSVIVLI